MDCMFIGMDGHLHGQLLDSVGGLLCSCMDTCMHEHFHDGNASCASAGGSAGGKAAIGGIAGGGGAAIGCTAVGGTGMLSGDPVCGGIDDASVMSICGTSAVLTVVDMFCVGATTYGQ